MLAYNYLLWLLVPFLALFTRRGLSRHIYLALASLAATYVSVAQDVSLNKDREAYAWIIKQVTDGATGVVEPGFAFLVAIADHISPGEYLHATVFLLISLLAVGTKFILFRRHGGCLFGALIAYFSYFFLAYDMTAIRAGLSIGLLYLAWMAWLERRLAYYWLLGLLSFLFHSSAIVFLLAPVLHPVHPKSQWQWHGFLLLLGSAACLSFMSSNWLLSLLSSISNLIGAGKLSTYTELFNADVFSRINLYRILPHLFLLSVFLARASYWLEDMTTVLLVRVYLIGILSFFAFMPMPALAYRFSDLFLFSGVLLIGRLRLVIARSTYYPFVIAYSAVFIVYTLCFTSLFSPNL